MVYPIVAYGHPVLKKKAEEIDQDYPDLGQLIDDMYETMYETVGVGLAAPQINKSIRLFIIDTGPFAEDDPEVKAEKKVFINPKIIEQKGEDEDFKESCLSLPRLEEYVNRKNKVRIQYYDENFKFHDEEFDKIAARVIQHEYDHLEGILYVERVSNLAKTLLRGKLRDIEKGKIDPPYKMIFGPKKKNR
ncbi:MAG: peptide deformylase [Bacteroidales bacterium]|nr:peptide deformylase [Bacteroidales bacterium]